MGLLDIVPAGVLTGDNVKKLFDYGKVYTIDFEKRKRKITDRCLYCSSKEQFRYPRH
jgi:hypothetical protein